MSDGLWIRIVTVIFVTFMASRPCAAQRTEDTGGGYIDSAVVRSQIRFRLDAGFDNPTPDRAEFVYPRCGCFTPGAGPGPPLPETGVDFQEVQAFFEAELIPGASIFTELPLRFITPNVNKNVGGPGDIRVGFKYAVVDTPDGLLTLQLRGYLPTGEGEKGLGTEHVSLEPGLLFQQDRKYSRLFGELRYWIPIDGSSGSGLTPDPVAGQDYAGSVLRYGIGCSFDLLEHNYVSVAPACSRLSLVTEVVGWSVLDGLQFRLAAPIPAETTIVNLKLGLRWTTPRNTTYVGYGRALTDDVWYRDMVRVEYSIRY